MSLLKNVWIIASLAYINISWCICAITCCGKDCSSSRVPSLNFYLFLFHREWKLTWSVTKSFRSRKFFQNLKVVNCDNTSYTYAPGNVVKFLFSHTVRFVSYWCVGLQYVIINYSIGLRTCGMCDEIRSRGPPSGVIVGLCMCRMCV